MGDYLVYKQLKISTCINYQQQDKHEYNRAKIQITMRCPSLVDKMKQNSVLPDSFLTVIHSGFKPANLRSTSKYTSVRNELDECKA